MLLLRENIVSPLKDHDVQRYTSLDIANAMPNNSYARYYSDNICILNASIQTDHCFLFCPNTNHSGFHKESEANRAWQQYSRQLFKQTKSIFNSK